MPTSPLAGLRVLLLEPDVAAGTRLCAALRENGLDVELHSGVAGAVQRLQRRGADAVLVGTAPAGHFDWLTAIAALRAEGAPRLVLLDAADVASALHSLLPARSAPDLVLPWPASVDELLLAIAALYGADPQREDPQPAESLPELLVALHERGDSGLLEIRADDLCTRLFLREGRPVFAEGGALRETLGRMLLRRGTLSEADYVRVIDRMTERLIENEATRMGEVLVELGLFTPTEVYLALKAQVLEKIIGCFRWERFEHDFQPLEELSEDVRAFDGPPFEALLLSGIRSYFGPDRLAFLLETRDGERAHLIAEAEEVSTRFQLVPGEQRLLRFLDGQRTLDGARAASTLDSLHTDQLLAALRVGRVLAFRPAAARRRRPLSTACPEGPDVPRPAPPGPPRPAPPRSAASPRSAAADGREAGMGVLARAVSAASLARLRDRIERRRRRPGAAAAAKAPRLEAERLFQQGTRLLAQAALPGALRAFAEACERNPEEPEYRMYEAWTAYLAARDDATRGPARVRARASAERMLQRDRDCARAHAILGQLRLAEGDLDEAERHFRAALRSAPEDREALRGMRMLGRRRAGGR